VSIRLKLLLLLLTLALPPAVLLGWQSLLRLDAMSASVAESSRANMEGSSRHYMREKVADIGAQLHLTTLATSAYLQEQKLLMETALAGAPTEQYPILYSEEVSTCAEVVEDRRFSRLGPDGETEYVSVSMERPSFLLTGGGEPDQEVQRTIQQLASTSQELKNLYRNTSYFSLWHHIGLANGVTMVYPGHGDYPAEYDSRRRRWYTQAVERGELTWQPLYIDAATGQPVLSASIPVYSPGGDVAGVTAIDLPMRHLLNFHSSTRPWMNVARLALIVRGPGEGLVIVAMKEPLQLDSDWRGDQKQIPLEELDPDMLAQIDGLGSGQSLLLEPVAVAGEPQMLALTAVTDGGSSYLGLLSPVGTIEAELDRELAQIKAQRDSMFRTYLVVAAALVVALVVAALFAAHRVTAPLIRMSATTRELGDGNLESRTGLQRRDEIGRLSDGIDRMADANERLQEEQETAYKDMILSLTRALEKKDSYTAAHSGRVTRYALQLGRRIDLDEKTLEKLRFGALTHDLGKIGIADDVLNKPAALGSDEQDIMRQHPEFSATIMKPLMRFREYAEIAGSHHERWDGRGYPEGLGGEEIPLLARIVAIADAWDAMTGDRVYHKGLDAEVAIGILDAEKDEGQFDPQLIREFIALVREQLK
jgi:response regulator RpfG family c-di-GMP phosphodiesterase